MPLKILDFCVNELFFNTVRETENVTQRRKVTIFLRWFFLKKTPKSGIISHFRMEYLVDYSVMEM